MESRNYATVGYQRIAPVVDHQDPEMGVISMTWQNIAITIGTAAILLLAGGWVLRVLMTKVIGRDLSDDAIVSPSNQGDVTQPPLWARPIVAFSATSLSVAALTIMTSAFDKQPAPSGSPPHSRCQMYEFYTPTRSCNFFDHRKAMVSGNSSIRSAVVGIKEGPPTVLDFKSKQP